MLPIHFFQPIPVIRTSPTHVLSQISLVITSTELPRTALARKISAFMIHRRDVQTAITSTAGRGWSACVSTIQRSLSLVQFLHVGLRGGFGLPSWMAVIQRRPTSLYTVPTSEHPVLTVSITQNRTKFVTRRAREETWTTKKGCGFFRDQPQLARPLHTDHASKKITYLGAIAAPSHHMPRISIVLSAMSR